MKYLYAYVAAFLTGVLISVGIATCFMNNPIFFHYGLYVTVLASFGGPISVWINNRESHE